ncbi:MAG: metallophosphoesterase [Candidatus Marsarchaeota archaeon]|nr:metallophosphoesterase [Candidatus Marsarchaeota archaeon]
MGYERFYQDAYAQAKDALEKVSNMADVVILPGDIFDKRAPKPEVIAQAINLFRELSKNNWKAKVIEFKGFNGGKAYTNIPVIAIPGTHERTSEGKENVLNLLALAGLVIDLSEASVLIELNNEKVAISGLGGISDERVKEYIKSINFKPVENIFNIFIFHQNIYELLPFDTNAMHYDDLPVGFDLYVDGHIHNMMEAKVHGKPFLIPGSTVLTQLKESEVGKKGFILFDTQYNSYKFIEINSRNFKIINILINNATPESFMKICESKIEESLKNESNPIIKVKLDGTIADDYSIIDMPIQSMIRKFSKDSVIEFDTSRIKSKSSEEKIDELRHGNLEGISIKELGMKMFINKLNELKFDEKFDPSKLFEILTIDESKEKVIKHASEFLQFE